MEKLDLKKQYKDLYSPSPKGPVQVQVPQLSFLAVEGQGDPSQPGAFTDAISALYPVAFTLKFMVKNGPLQIDYPVMPLQALWWADDWAAFREGRRVEWKWRAMIMTPDLVTQEMLSEAKAAVAEKKGHLPELDNVQLIRWEEGLAAQLLHIGPYGEETENIQRLHEFIVESGFELAGAHHEIYLSDPNRTAPEKLKTIIRQPMCAVCKDS